jgi:hypothetical protein
MFSGATDAATLLSDEPSREALHRDSPGLRVALSIPDACRTILHAQKTKGCIGVKSEPPMALTNSTSKFT